MDHVHFMKKVLTLAEQALGAGEFPAACLMCFGALLIGGIKNIVESKG